MSKQEKFLKAAESLTAQIEKRSNLFSSSTPTARRARFIEQGLKEAEQLRYLQNALRQMAKIWETGIVDPQYLSLTKISSKKQVEDLLSKPYRSIEENYPNWLDSLPKAGLNTYAEYSVARDTLLALIEDSTDKVDEEEQKRKAEIRSLEMQLIGTKIDQYFPTPLPVIEHMLMYVTNVNKNTKFLESSAGKGNIADLLKKDYSANISVMEIVPTLQKILKLKGHNVIGYDFLEHSGEYDYIIQNPPFNSYRDVDHVKHAYKNLKSGGKLISIMSSSAFNNSHKKAEEFRAWLDFVNARYEALPDKSFASSERPTGVSTYLVVIEKV